MREGGWEAGSTVLADASTEQSLPRCGGGWWEVEPGRERQAGTELGRPLTPAHLWMWSQSPLGPAQDKGIEEKHLLSAALQYLLSTFVCQAQY